MLPTDFSSANQAISFETESWTNLVYILKEVKPSKIFVLVDRNTNQDCLPILKGVLNSIEIESHVLEVEAGEKSKDLKVCETLWNQLTALEADRHALLINLGGGMITDLGGFVAAIYKRGISFLNIPTTLLAMVDASIGGKCGIDFNHFKNHLGVFQTAISTLIYPEFLKTLDQIELKSGFAEAIKHALIADSAYWKQIVSHHQKSFVSEAIIKKSITIKTSIVSKDPTEKGERKKLNFGHTLGHALESYFFQKNEPIPHGYAIASGMMMEAYISSKLSGLDQSDLQRIIDLLRELYPIYTFKSADISKILDNLSQDKKNFGGITRFCLLSKIGEAVVDQSVDKELIVESITYYQSLR